EQEFYRSHRFQLPLSIAIIHCQADGHRKETVMKEILHSKRRIDLLGRYEKECYALILPETDGARALNAAQRLKVNISKFECAPPLSIGIACLPEDGLNLSVLLSAAEYALAAARESSTVVRFLDLAGGTAMIQPPAQRPSVPIVA